MLPEPLRWGETVTAPRHREAFPMNPLIPIALAWTLLQSPPSHAPRVADDARLFSESAVARANDSLGTIARATGWEVVIKTVDSLGGKPIKDETASLAK